MLGSLVIDSPYEGPRVACYSHIQVSRSATARKYPQGQWRERDLARTRWESSWRRRAALAANLVKPDRVSADPSPETDYK